MDPPVDQNNKTCDIILSVLNIEHILNKGLTGYANAIYPNKDKVPYAHAWSDVSPSQWL